jgi:cysteine-rich repeat protein
VAESCDDGNKASGDGCGPNCMIEQGFICSGEPSKCAKKVTACGNGIVEPENNEQCDNGNRLGCFGCRVQAGWDCMSLSGFPSKCSPKVVTPSCGNGVLEPEKG